MIFSLLQDIQFQLDKLEKIEGISDTERFYWSDTRRYNPMVDEIITTMNKLKHELSKMVHPLGAHYFTTEDILELTKLARNLRTCSSVNCGLDSFAAKDLELLSTTMWVYRDYIEQDIQ